MKQHTKEYWRPIFDYPHYEVSTHGRIRSWKKARWGRADKPRILRTQPHMNGYRAIHLRYKGQPQNKTYLVHRIVAYAFLPGVGPIVRHLDGDRTNNHVDNLAWGTYKDNHADMVAHGNRKITGKLTPKAVRKIRTLESDHDVEEVADAYGVHTTTIYRVWRDATWSHVEPKGGEHV